MKKKGFIPIDTNWFDRLFIGVISFVALQLFWMRFLENIRVMKGTNFDYFSEQGKQTFYEKEFIVSKLSDRMGMRVLDVYCGKHWRVIKSKN